MVIWKRAPSQVRITSFSQRASSSHSSSLVGCTYALRNASPLVALSTIRPITLSAFVHRPANPSLFIPYSATMSRSCSSSSSLSPSAPTQPRYDSTSHRRAVKAWESHCLVRDVSHVPEHGELHRASRALEQFLLLTIRLECRLVVVIRTVFSIIISLLCASHGSNG